MYIRVLVLSLVIAVSCGGCYYDQRVQPQPDPAPIVDPLPVQEKPGIVGEDSVAPGAPIWLTADVEPGSVAAWTVESPDGMQFRTYEDQHEFASAGPIDAKEVRVALSVARMEADKLILKVVRKTIAVKGQEPRPDPEPGPTPDPKPDPQPAPVGPSYALIVYQSEELPKNPSLAVLMQSDFGKQVMDGGGKFRFYDADHPDAGPQYAAELKQRFIDLPGVLVYSLDGKTVVDAFALGEMSKDDVLKKLGVK